MHNALLRDDNTEWSVPFIHCGNVVDFEYIVVFVVAFAASNDNCWVCWITTVGSENDNNDFSDADDANTDADDGADNNNVAILFIL